MGGLLEETEAGTAPVVMVLSGLRGVGKSVVGRHWAQAMRDRFTGGQFYVDFGSLRHRGGVEVSDVLGGFLRALGVHEEWIPATLVERAALFRSRTAERPVLVLLDDARTAAEVMPLLPASAGSVVLVTTDHHLDELITGGARSVPLEPLDAAHGAALLERMIGADRVAVEPAEVASLVRLCAGLPVALCVVGARLVKHRRWPLARMVAELRDADSRLDRLSTVEAVFDTAYADLPAEVARFYRRMGLHPGPDFDANAAAVLAGVSTAAAQDFLDSLGDAHLIESGDGERHQFHGLVRLHASRRASEELLGEESTRRLFDWYLVVASAADQAVMGARMRLADHDAPDPSLSPALTTPAEGIDWLETERHNLLAAVRGSAARGWDDLAWQLCEPLWVLYQHYPHHADWIESHRLAVESARRCGDLRAQARMRCQLARAYLELSRLDEAHTELVGALDGARASGDRRLEASVVEFTGLLQDARGDHEAAVEAFDQAREINESIGSRRGMALQMYLLGRSLGRAGRHEEAIDALEAALPLFDELADERTAAHVTTSLGSAYLSVGRHDAARVALTRAVEILRGRHLPVQEAEALEVLAEVARVAGDAEVAGTCLRRAMDLYAVTGSPHADRLRQMLSEA